MIVLEQVEKVNLNWRRVSSFSEEGQEVTKIVGGEGRWTVNCWVSMIDMEVFKQFEGM